MFIFINSVSQVQSYLHLDLMFVLIYLLFCFSRLPFVALIIWGEEEEGEKEEEEEEAHRR